MKKTEKDVQMSLRLQIKLTREDLQFLNELLQKRIREAKARQEARQKARQKRTKAAGDTVKKTGSKT